LPKSCSPPSPVRRLSRQRRADPCFDRRQLFQTAEGRSRKLTNHAMSHHSEAAFKTLKYSPQFPPRFGSQEEAQAFCREYFAWYNQRHHHTGPALLTLAQAHYGDPVALLAARHQTLLAAYERCPARFGYRLPRLEVLPAAVYINPPVAPSPAVAA
jgi:hypothetical protein